MWCFLRKASCILGPHEEMEPAPGRRLVWDPHLSKLSILSPLLRFSLCRFASHSLKA